MIDSYGFGSIVISGRRYRSDVIIFKDKVMDDWWRKEGHRMCLDDLKEVLDAEPKPEVLVVGTGYSGFMSLSEHLKEILRSAKIEVIVQPTEQACQTFNELLKSKKNVVATLHLTC